MVVIIKKSNALFLLAAVILSVFTFGMVKNTGDVKPTAALPGANKVIVLDAGHGTPDGGATGSSGTLEKDINLKIAQKLQALLEQSGTIVVMTRADDNSIADISQDSKIRDIKRNDLKNRKNYRDESDADLFLSIHMNKFPESKYKGAQVFYSATPANSKVLGEILQSELINVLDPSNTRVAKQADRSIYILKDATVPSAIVECGFLSNPEEEALLNDNEYQQKVAWAIYSGVLKYFEKTAES